MTKFNKFKVGTKSGNLFAPLDPGLPKGLGTGVNPCYYCQGSGELLTEIAGKDTIVQCSFCAGTGMELPSQRKNLGIGSREAKKPWKDAAREERQDRHNAMSNLLEKLDEHSRDKV